MGYRSRKQPIRGSHDERTVRVDRLLDVSSPCRPIWRNLWAWPSPHSIRRTFGWWAGARHIGWRSGARSIGWRVGARSIGWRVSARSIARYNPELGWRRQHRSDPAGNDRGRRGQWGQRDVGSHRDRERFSLCPVSAHERAGTRATVYVQRESPGRFSCQRLSPDPELWGALCRGSLRPDGRNRGGQYRRSNGHDHAGLW